MGLPTSILAARALHEDRKRCRWSRVPLIDCAGGRQGTGREGSVDCSLSNPIERLTAAGEWLRARLCSFGAVPCLRADWRAGAGWPHPWTSCSARPPSENTRPITAPALGGSVMGLPERAASLHHTAAPRGTTSSPRHAASASFCVFYHLLLGRIRFHLPSFTHLTYTNGPIHPIASLHTKSSGHKMHQSGTRRLVARWLFFWVCFSRTCHDARGYPCNHCMAATTTPPEGEIGLMACSICIHTYVHTSSNKTTMSGTMAILTSPHSGSSRASIRASDPQPPPKTGSLFAV